MTDQPPISEAPAQPPQGIDAEVFFRDFLSADPRYRAVMVVLDRLRQRMGEFMGRRTLPLSELIDMTSVEYGRDGRVVPKEERLLRMLAQAMRQVDITRETLQAAAGSALTDEQISEGPMSIKVPLSLMEDVGRGAVGEAGTSVRANGDAQTAGFRVAYGEIPGCQWTAIGPRPTSAARV